jgi:SAM-dependent methyltransferase
MSNIKTHKQYGYRYVDPKPSEEKLNKFYANEYYENPKNRVLDPSRFMGDTSDVEINWLSTVLWNDIDEILSYRTGGGAGRLLDWGCGTGHFLNFMRQRRWDTYGVEPSTKAARYAIDNFSIRIIGHQQPSSGAFDAITLLNVLEHVKEPEELINTVHFAMRKHGALVVRVPNDFSELQSAAKRARGKNKQWWVRSPDHLNYFDFNSISRLLNTNGFYVVDEFGDFPMEFFIMFGDDYIDNPEIGAACHEKRMNLELALPTDVRQSMYRSFAEQDIVRNCLVIAMKK